MHDRLADDRPYRLLTVVTSIHANASPWKSLSDSVPTTSLTVLQRACRERGAPKVLRCDNGTEFVAKPLDQWAFWNKIALDFSRPGKPTDNAFIESFNGGVRRELLNPSYFETIEQARSAARVWREEYNEFRPHSMLGNQTPKEFAAALQNQIKKSIF